MDTFTIGNIGVGPIFSTQTKPNANPVGISYVYWAKQFSKFSIVAIGGIKAHNIQEVAQRGVDCIAVVTDITTAPDIDAKINQLRVAMKKSIIEENES